MYGHFDRNMEYEGILLRNILNNRPPLLDNNWVSTNDSVYLPELWSPTDAMLERLEQEQDLDLDFGSTSMDIPHRKNVALNFEKELDCAESLKQFDEAIKRAYNTYRLCGLRRAEAIKAIFDAIAPFSSESEQFNFGCISEAGKNAGLSEEENKRAFELKVAIDMLSSKTGKIGFVPFDYEHSEEQKDKIINAKELIAVLIKKIEDSTGRYEEQLKSQDIDMTDTKADYQTQKKIFDMMQESKAEDNYVHEFFDNLHSVKRRKNNEARSGEDNKSET